MFLFEQKKNKTFYPFEKEIEKPLKFLLIFFAPCQTLKKIA